MFFFNFYQIFGIFDDFSKYKALRNIDKSSNMPKYSAKNEEKPCSTCLLTHFSNNPGTSPKAPALRVQPEGSSPKGPDRRVQPEGSTPKDPSVVIICAVILEQKRCLVQIFQTRITVLAMRFCGLDQQLFVIKMLNKHTLN